VCSHDKDNILSKAELGSISTCLLGQITEWTGAKEGLADAFGALIGVSEDIWKSLHTGLLMRTRSEARDVKVLCCLALTRIWTTIGEEFLIHFPESLPFLSELLEDTDSEVERDAQKLCLKIQEYLGEDISTYFNQ
jgi:U3 small nucleolar RNA-associated protein 10